MPLWADLSSEAVGAAAASGAVAVLPVGALEQHGPHLPTGTDLVIAERVAVAAAQRTGDVVLPVLGYGCSLGHTAHWPGTVSLSPATMTALVVDVGRWVHASGFRKLVLVNAHATNGPPCQCALLQLRHELADLRMRFVSTFEVTEQATAGYLCDAPDPHANEAETSLMLHLAPAGVHMDRAVDEPDLTIGRVLQYAMPLVTRSGVVGRATAGAAEPGRALFDVVVAGVAELLVRARAETDPL